jgi:hypothetical protein
VHFDRSFANDQPFSDLAIGQAIAWESGYQVVRDGRSGRILTRTPQRGYVERRFGAGGCTVHRADLLDVLAAALPADSIKLGARCIGVQASAHGASARFADGTEIEADVIVGADGIHSAVRASLIGPDAPVLGSIRLAWVRPGRADGSRCMSCQMCSGRSRSFSRGESYDQALDADQPDGSLAGCRVWRKILGAADIRPKESAHPVRAHHREPTITAAELVIA